MKKKTILITGATSGIGLSCVKLLVKKENNLILIARNENKLFKLKEELLQSHNIKIVTLASDITDYKKLDKQLNNLDILSEIDVVINNAGLSLESDKLDRTEIDDIYQMINTNILGNINILKICIPFMLKKKTSDIINISSVAGSIQVPNESIYSATKAFLSMLSKSLNIDYSESGMRISNLSPGAVKTNFANVRYKGSEEKAKNIYKGYTPLEADDIANIIGFILEAPRHVNISEITVMPTTQRNFFK